MNDIYSSFLNWLSFNIGIMSARKYTMYILLMSATADVLFFSDNLRLQCWNITLKPRGYLQTSKCS